MDQDVTPLVLERCPASKMLVRCATPAGRVQRCVSAQPGQCENCEGPEPTHWTLIASGITWCECALRTPLLSYKVLTASGLNGQFTLYPAGGPCRWRRYTGEFTFNTYGNGTCTGSPTPYAGDVWWQISFVYTALQWKVECSGDPSGAFFFAHGVKEYLDCWKTHNKNNAMGACQDPPNEGPLATGGSVTIIPHFGMP